MYFKKTKRNFSYSKNDIHPSLIPKLYPNNNVSCTTAYDSNKKEAGT